MPALATTSSQALAFRQVRAGLDYSCGVTADDRAYCWGNNFYGQLGNGTTYGSPTPVAVAGGLHFLTLEVGGGHVCGVTTDNRAYCWGYNYRGQLGLGTTTGPETCNSWPCSTRPVAVADPRHFRQVVAGDAHSCGMTMANVALCWGMNNEGQLGDSTTTDRLKPVRVRTGALTFRDLAAGSSHTCAVSTDDRAFCWGSNLEGQLGDGTKTDRSSPVAVAGIHSFTQVSAGSMHTCAVTTDNLAYCWGWNYDGQLGTGTAYPNYPRRLKPIAVLGGLHFSAVRPGSRHTCGLAIDGTAYCWGDNYSGQLGDGTHTDRSTPVAVHGGLKFRAVNAGGEHSCGATTGSLAYCWGSNHWGQLGTGNFDDHATPAAVVGPI